MDQKLTCIVTIHGIGFQQPPLADGTPGYADTLHERLRSELPAGMLGDDPGRAALGQATGPVYVQSHWPPSSANSEAGLARLGTWTLDTHRDINHDRAPLVGATGQIAHVALVYSHLEEQDLRIGTFVETAAKVAAAIGHYTGLVSLVEHSVLDAMSAFGGRPRGATPGSSLRVRSRVGVVLGEGTGSGAQTVPSATGISPQPSNALAVIGQLENDITTYVCRNDLRERVRSFVHDALLRLCCRDDVASIVVNSHSQGTVLAYDVLRTLPPFAVAKIHGFVTCGSPLRKYMDIFYWGSEVAGIAQVDHWLNFWDARDPVADPLAPPASWKLGDPVPVPPPVPGLFSFVPSGAASGQPVTVEDTRVDNLTHSQGGGLQAHNYWDNQSEVVKPLAQLVQQTLSAQAAPAGAAG